MGGWGSTVLNFLVTKQCHVYMAYFIILSILFFHDFLKNLNLVLNRRGWWVGSAVLDKVLKITVFLTPFRSISADSSFRRIAKDTITSFISLQYSYQSLFGNCGNEPNENA